MKIDYCEFAPIDIDRANDLKEIINRAAIEEEAVVIDPEERGIVGSSPTGLISSTEDVNALSRYRRHY
jgi:hypothetical protein